MNGQHEIQALETLDHVVDEPGRLVGGHFDCIAGRHGLLQYRNAANLSSGYAVDMSTGPVYIPLQRRGVVTLPAELRRELHLDQPGAQLRLEEVRPGVYEMTAVAAVPADQVWFWEERWQQLERGADADQAAGRTVSTQNLVEFLAELDD